MRVVVDTNLYVSALINYNSRQRLNQILQNEQIDILMDEAAVSELHTVIHRPKFRKYVTFEQVSDFFQLIIERASVAQTTSIVQVSPDPNDDFLLALCLDNEVDYLITGNKLDLLALGRFEQTQIVTLRTFLERTAP